MRSLQVTNSNFIKDKQNYSELKVMISAASWYVGTFYKDSSMDFWEPGSRDTCYFKTEEDAKLSLAILEKLDSIKNVINKTSFICESYQEIMLMLGLDPQSVGYRLTP